MYVVYVCMYVCMYVVSVCMYVCMSVCSVRSRDVGAVCGYGEHAQVRDALSRPAQPQLSQPRAAPGQLLQRRVREPRAPAQVRTAQRRSGRPRQPAEVLVPQIHTIPDRNIHTYIHTLKVLSAERSYIHTYTIETIF
jgi:hypothetical protein